jgi:drug/metabolite transporter (DMT)-like permease
MTPPIAERRWLVPVAFLLVYVIWGSTYLAIHEAIKTIPPFVMAGVRFLVAGAVLYAIARMMGAPRPQKGEWKPAAIVGLFLLLGGNGGVVQAQLTVPSGIAALIIAGVAIWMALFEAIRPGGRWPSWQVGLGLLIGLGGVALLVAPRGAGSVDPWGAVSLIAAEISWAIGSIYARGAKLPKSAFVATAVEMMAGGAGLLLLAVPTGQWGMLDVRAISMQSVIAMTYLAVFGSMVAFTAYVWLLSVRPPSLVATYAYVNPVVAVFLGVVFLNEKLTPMMVVAAVAILGSVGLITTFSNRRRKPEAVRHQEEVLHEQRA